MSTLSKEQLASFRELARNGTSTEKQAKLMKDAIESAAKRDLHFIEGDDFLKHQQDLVKLGVITIEEAKAEGSMIRGSYSDGKFTGRPRIQINPTQARKTTRLHELTHFADDLSGNLYGRGRTYANLQKTVGSGLEEFLDGPQYEAITDGLRSSYTGDEIRKLPHELFTVLTQGKADEATRHLFTEGSTAQEILNKLWQARGYQKGGMVYASNGALISALKKGTDTVPAMLTPGEFVVNRQATQQHMPVLQAINSGAYNQGGVVKYLAEGGMVSPSYYKQGGVANGDGGMMAAFAGMDMSAIKELASSLADLKDTFGSLENIKDLGNNLQSAVSNMGATVNSFGEHISNIPGQVLHNVTANVTQHVTGLGEAGRDILGQATSNANVISQNNVARVVHNLHTNSEGAITGGNPDGPMGRVGGMA